MDPFSIIMTVFSAIMGAVGIAATAKANRENLENQQQMLAQQQEYNRENAATANKETRAQYADMYSPGALVEQYEEAGLSPSIMYSNGAGVVGASTAAMAQGTNMNAPMVNPTVSNNFSQITDMLKSMRESELSKAERQKTEQNILNLQNEIDVNNTKIKEILSNIGVNNSTEKLNAVRTQLEGFNAVGKQVENEISLATKEKKIEIVSQGLVNMKKEFDKLQKDIDLLEIDKETRNELNNAIIDNYQAMTGLYYQQQTKTYVDSWLSVANIYLAGSQVRKNYAEAAKLREDVNTAKKTQQQIEANISYLNSLKGKTDNESMLLKKRLASETINQMNGLMNLMGGYQNLIRSGGETLPIGY